MRKCEIGECERQHFGKGMCKMHYNRWYFEEFPEKKHYARNRSRVASALRRSEDRDGYNSYSRIHQSLKNTYGKAGAQFCINFTTCMSFADDWALKNDSDEIIHSKHFHWSENLDDYMAMCRVCHSEYDRLARENDESNIERGYN